MDSYRDIWSEEELREVYTLYPKVKYAIHKHNMLIIDLATKLNKKTRGVENQLLMFRAVEKEILENDTYGRKNYNKLIKKIYLESVNTMDKNTSDQITISDSLSYPTRFKQFVKTNDGAVRKSNDESSGRPIGEMIELPMHQFISKTIESHGSKHKILFLIGGPGNGKTDATDFAFNQFIKSQKVTTDLELRIRREYIEQFSKTDNYYSSCSINNTSFYCIQDATSRMHDSKNNLAAFIHVYNHFKQSFSGILIVCINRGVLNDFINQSKDNEEILNLIKEVEDSSNLESYLKEKNNHDIKFEHGEFQCSLSTYPLDKSSLFSANSNVHKDVCEIINSSNWSIPANLNFGQSYFKSMTNEISDLINLYEIKNNKKVTFREYYHWLHLLFTPNSLELTSIIDSPLSHLWKLATTQSINTVQQLTGQLQDSLIKRELQNLLTDLRKLNKLIEQNKTLNAVQEFHPNFLSNVWDTDKIYSLVTSIRDQIQNVDQAKKPINFGAYNISEITNLEIQQLNNLIDLYSKIDNHILDTKTKEIEKIRKFLLIVIRNFLCAIDFRINGNYYLKTELIEFRKLDKTGSKKIQETLRKLLRIRDDGSHYYRMKVALNNNIWEYSFANDNVIDGEIENIEKAFEFKNISFSEKPPIEIKLFVSAFSDGAEIVTFIDFGTFLHIIDSDSLFNPDFKRISSTISPNFKLWLNSEAEKFVSGRFHEIDSISIPKIARVTRRNNNRLSIENLS
jgi:hypothetical protein